MARKQRVIAASKLIPDFVIYGQCRAGSLRNCREPFGVLLALRVANAAAVIRPTTQNRPTKANWSILRKFIRPSHLFESLYVGLQALCFHRDEYAGAQSSVISVTA